MMTDSKLAFTTHRKVLVVLLGSNMQSPQAQKWTKQPKHQQLLKKEIHNETQMFMMSDVTLVLA